MGILNEAGLLKSQLVKNIKKMAKIVFIIFDGLKDLLSLIIFHLRYINHTLEIRLKLACFP